MKKIVQLRAAKIPTIIGYIAVHYWFVIINNSQIDRWEIWQTANLHKQSWGHLYKNLLQPEQGVGNGDSWLEYEWTGKNADLLIEIIENSPNNYQYNYLYRYWPGPNSNTYIQWVLNTANLNYFLSSHGIGKDYLGLIGFRKTKQIMQFSTPLLGFKIMLFTEIELHILTLTFGIKIKPFLIKTPWRL